MTSRPTCPVCASPLVAGMCRRCAFSTALAGLNVETPEESSVADEDVPEGFVLLREIGVGATAVVWLARDQQLDRLVALKLIAGADRRLMQRLVREAQAAARLRHPHIVAVHALRATERQAYLSMDLMEGGDLRARLASGLPPPRTAADWVRKLAAALGHAHTNSILHRDIKPSNVLLNAESEPHLADFGLAAPLEGAGDLTLPGQVAGTAAYLAPELLAGANHASPLSDLYSLGAVLYECLTGRAPFGGDSAAAIFAQLASTEPVAPRLLRADIPRDLETICLKCLEKTPARRYASARALEDDLERFLRGEPIAARPVTAVGKTFRWCRRRPAETAAEAAASKAVSEFLQNDLLAQADPEQQRDRDLKVQTVLDRAARNIDGRFPRQPLVEADVRETLANTYKSLGEYAVSVQHWTRTWELRKQSLGPDDPKTLRAQAGLVCALLMQVKITEAEPLGREVLRAQRRVLGPEHPETLSSMSNLGLILHRRGDFAEEEALWIELLQLRRRVSGSEHPDTLAAINNLANVEVELGKLVEGVQLRREVLELIRRVRGVDHPNTLVALNNLAAIYYDFGDLAEAEKVCVDALERRRRVLGPSHPATLISLVMLAKIHARQNRLAESEHLYREILELQKNKLGPEHPDVLITMNNLALRVREQGRFAEAERLHLDIWERFRRVLGSDHPYTLNSMGKVIGIYCDLGKWEEVTRLGTEAVAQCERLLGMSHRFTIQAQRELGRALLHQLRATEAEPLLRRAVENSPIEVKSTWLAAADRVVLGRALLALDRHDEGERFLIEGYEELKRQSALIPPTDQRFITEAATALAILYRARQKPEQARIWEERSSDLAASR